MWNERTEALIGADNIEKIEKANIAVFGVGGVGTFCIESLVRAGVLKITIVDGDVVCESNLNRQLIATVDSLNKPKVEVMKERLLKINSNVEVTAIYDFYTPENRDKFNLSAFDYVVDAIDSVPNKIDLIKTCYENNIQIISSMGTANKLDPLQFCISDIHKTSVCPLAKVIRKKAKELNIKKLKVLYSKELPVKPIIPDVKLGSISFVPSTAGLIIAGEVIRDIIKK